MRLREAFLTVCFGAFLYPVTLNALSVNYSFLLLPLFVVARDRKLKIPPPAALLAIGLFTLVFILASLYQFDFLDEGMRRFVSFVIFMSVFSYMFIEIDDEMVWAFKTALVIISLVFSLTAIFRLVIVGGSGLGFEAKDLVGSQRFGFVYLLAIWLVYLQERRGTMALGYRYVILMVLFAGLLLTFSRSAIVALVASVALFAVVRQWAWARRPRLTSLMKASVSIIGVGVIVAAVSALFPVAVTFFDERLYTFLVHGDVAAHLVDPETSEGTRVLLAGKILSFVLNNPLTGSGYLGVWILSGDLSGSAHNQYTDVLFRTGLMGFVAYGCLMLVLLRYLSNHDKPLLWGLMGVLAYGIFHETFKESQGAFVLAFLLGMMAQSMRVAQRADRGSAGYPSVHLQLRTG